MLPLLPTPTRLVEMGLNILIIHGCPLYIFLMHGIQKFNNSIMTHQFNRKVKFTFITFNYTSSLLATNTLP